MSRIFKGKSKGDPGKMTGGPSIRVEETPPELPRERSFRHKAKEKLKNLFSVRSSNSRSTSRGPSERGKSQEYPPVSDTTANSNIGDQNRSVEMRKNDLGESINTADRGIGSVDKAFEEATVDTEGQCVNFPMSTSYKTAEWAPQDSIQASKRQVQVMDTISGSAFPERKPDKGKGRNNEAEELGGAGELESRAAMPGQDYDKSGIPEVDVCEKSHSQLSDTGGPPTQGVASQFQGAHHVTISGDSRFENVGIKHEYNYINQGGTYDMTVLKEFVSFGALYNSFIQDPTRRVHPGTRQRVLKCIQDWIDAPSAKERIFWLHGPAGVGKSAIAQTIARSCTKGKMVATFFFYRSDPGRNNGNRLFTTLAWQFASTIPATKNALIHSLIESPDIPMTDVETQFEELIVKPFLELKRSGVRLSAPVVIIDGVDECSDDNLQRRFLKIIGNAVKDDRVPLRFLICSRPEAHIQDTMNIFRSHTLALDLAKLDDANHDIEIYLRAEFSRIATEQDLDPAWPGEYIIRDFVFKASGQFVYASTLIKYVGDEYSSAPTQLDIIRGLKPASSISPFAELDELYKEILRRQRDPVFLEKFLSLFIGRKGMELDNLHEDDAMLLNVSEKELHRKLRGMRSLLKFEPYIDVHHRSFLEFLQDSSRSSQYHTSKQTGTSRYLDLIAGALVQYASTVIEGHHDHNTHFSPRFHALAIFYPPRIVLPVEEWEKALQPLLDLQNKLLTLPNFRSTWEFLPCKRCTGFRAMHGLLLNLVFLGASDCVFRSPLMAESYIDGSEEMHTSSVISLISTETGTNTLSKVLDACLSLLIPRLRRRKLGISLDADTIRLVCSLLHFDRAEIVMRLRSILDAQNLVDIIDELINNKSFSTDYSTDLSRKAAQLALEIYSRVPVLPRSLFSKGTVGPRHDVWLASREIPVLESLFQTVFMSKILDPRYIVRVSWVYEHNKILFSVVGKVNENSESLSKWRKRSNPSSGIRIRVMLSVAKALRYFHTMGIVLHYLVDSDDIFLDPQFHAKFRFIGVTVNTIPHMVLRSDYQSRDASIFLFGCLFYEMCFGIKIGTRDRRSNKSNAVARRPSRPEIRDNEWQLIQRCCAKEPKSRPTMDEVVREMETWDIS